MYFEFESMSASLMASESSAVTPAPVGGLTRRHRRLSSSTQSLRDVLDAENVLENITPSHCDLYLITRKKLSAMNANTIKQSHDLRREVLLTSIHRTITCKPSAQTSAAPTPLSASTATTPSFNELSPITSSTLFSADTPMTTTTTAMSHPMALRDESSLLHDSTLFYSAQQMAANCDQQFKYDSQSSTTSTSTTTQANNSGTRMTSMSTTTTTTTPSVIKKRNLAPNPIPNGDYEEEWKTTIKRLKVVHGLDMNGFDVSMESEFESGYCDTDLNDLTNNFHSLKTPFT
ncbi:unnamed protein product [Medioppia subpectinata]|uniref:Uncharacterized protein n=1 Tax=Medioppia subpectinata TaxID=1979941 RepID=A0A7R9PTV4_9ACAR|nr:unnamed protein product [Medioppia subpectinata]CAG2100852.1 unnamed protein product [Medioppia subpectinata]